MAAKKANGKNGKNGFEAPEGFERTSPPDGPQNWVKFEEGLVIKGNLIGRFERKNRTNNKIQYFYQIQLTEPLKAWRKPNKEDPAEEVQCEAGETVCIDEKHKLKCLQDIIDDGAKYSVVIHVEDQIDLDNQQTMWNAAVFHKRISGQRTRKQEDDIPF